MYMSETNKYGEVSAEEAARVLLTKTTGLISDAHGEGTPRRFAAMLAELTTPKVFEFKTFPADGAQDMVVMHNIPFVSVCNHHVIPFVGHAWIGYVPDQKLVGLSKLARAVHYYAKALQVQERLTVQVANFLEDNLEPLGLAVLMEAEHMCMTIRGVQTPGTITTTSTMRGVFADHSRTAKSEFLSIIGK